MTWEIGWALHREVQLGRVICGSTFRELAICLRIATTHGSRQARAAVSMMQLSPDEWVREAASLGVPTRPCPLVTTTGPVG